MNRLQNGQQTNLGLIQCRDKRFISPPKHPGWPWDPPNLLFSGYARLLWQV